MGTVHGYKLMYMNSAPADKPGTMLQVKMCVLVRLRHHPGCSSPGSQ